MGRGTGGNPTDASRCEAHRINLHLKYILQLQTNYKKLVKIQIYSVFFLYITESPNRTL